ncbi:MAG: DUF2889 domain-containing protein [Acidocella sp.]|nr:DUF2889 domain-containing protein [Acidocella sp.]
MPLTRPAPRKLLHLRDIELRGYERADGLVDIEVHMTDTKSYSWANHDRGDIASGEALHDMWMRVTLDRDMVIQHCEAAMDATPYTMCPNVAANFGRLAGLTIGRGFLKAAMQRVGGVEGCTHLRELLQPLATVAFQTRFSLSHRGDARPKQDSIPPSLVDTCYAYAANGVLAQGHNPPASD